MSNRIDITQKAIQEAISGNTYIGRLVSADDLRGLPGNKIDVLIDGEVSMRAAVEVPVLPNPEDAIEGIFYITPDGVIHYLADGEWKSIVADGAKIYRVHELPTTDIDPQGIYIIDATEEEGGGADVYTLAFMTNIPHSAMYTSSISTSTLDWNNGDKAYIYKNGSLLSTISDYDSLKDALTEYAISGLIPFYRTTSYGVLNLDFIGYKVNSLGVVTGGTVSDPIFKIQGSLTDPNGLDGNVPHPLAEEKNMFLTANGDWQDSRRVMICYTKRNFFDANVTLKEFLQNTGNTNIDSYVEYSHNGVKQTPSISQVYNALYQNRRVDLYQNYMFYFVDASMKDLDRKISYGFFETPQWFDANDNDKRQYPVMGISNNISTDTRYDYIVLLTNGKLDGGWAYAGGDWCGLPWDNIAGGRLYRHNADSSETSLALNSLSNVITLIQNGDVNGNDVYFVDALRPWYVAYAHATLADNTAEDPDNPQYLRLRSIAWTEESDYWLMNIPASSLPTIFGASEEPEIAAAYTFPSTAGLSFMQYSQANTELASWFNFTLFKEQACPPCKIYAYTNYGQASQRYIGEFICHKYLGLTATSIDMTCMTKSEAQSATITSAKQYSVYLNSSGVSHVSKVPGSNTLISSYITRIRGYNASETSVGGLTVAEFCAQVNKKDGIYLWDDSGSTPSYIGCGYLSVANPTINAIIVEFTGA